MATTTFTIRVSYILFFTFFCCSVTFSQTFEISKLETEVYDSERTGKIREVDISFAQGLIPTPTTVEVIDGYVLIEGDIILGTEQEIFGGRAAIINLSSRQWPNSIIPYSIEAGYPEPNMIFAAINHITNQTNLCIIPRTTETNYIEFVNASGCASHIGMKGGPQPIWINPACGVASTVHELLHAAGHYHEQARGDRNNYVTINEHNIQLGKEHNFNPYSTGMDIGTYDYASIMHYSPYAFSDNGLPTIEVKSPPANASTNIGQRVGMSIGDINAVNQIYTATPSCSDIVIPPNLSCRNLGTLTINGGIVTIAGFEVENTGSASIGVSTAYFYYSVGNIATVFGNATIPSLTAGGIHTIGTSKDLTNLPDGDYKIGVWINAIKSPTEGTYRDNNFKWNAPVLSLPALPSNCPADSLALVALYNATDGPNWANTWDLNQPINTWHGVTVNSNGCVIGLNLTQNLLIGSIPAEIGELIALQTLQLQVNQLSGSIPNTIGNLSFLQKLDLSNSQLSGVIPTTIGNLTALKELHLKNADLSGSIPVQISNLQQLEKLLLHNNLLSGTIPTSIGDLPNLKELSLSANQLRGTIPTAIASLSNLESLFLNSNQLVGAIPTALTTLTKLKSLHLAGNQLTGTIPIQIGNLTNLQLLSFEVNQLTGTIPTSIGDLVNIQTLSFKDNQLTGSIPKEMGKLTNVFWLNLGENQLTGSIPAEIGNIPNLQGLYLNDNQLSGNLQTSLSNLTSLQVLWLQKNQFTGCFPQNYTTLCSTNSYNFTGNPNLPGGGNFANFCTNGTGACIDCNRVTDSLALVALYAATNGTNWKTTWNLNLPIDTWHGITLNTEGCVIYIDLVSNDLAGTIPLEIGNISSLQRLILRGNDLTGSIPTTIGNLTNLEWLFLSNNQLSSIPPTIGNLTNVQRINLFNNELTGSIPPEMGNLTNLVSLGLGTNQLTGSIPPELGNLINLSSLDLGFGGNQLTGSIPSELGNLSNLKSLTLSNNPLTGTIPSTLGNLINLERLAIYNTGLTGNIPLELGNLTKLEALLLYINQLSGTIPPELGNLSNLTELDIAYNQLTGSIPAEIGNLNKLERLRLYRNQLSGSIPWEIGNLYSLTELFISDNQLTGIIPASIGNLTNLRALILEDNQLNGCFPQSLSVFCDITYRMTNNPNLPGGGDFAAFCANGTGGCIDPVWPGDFNYDGIVNNADALYWGLACENIPGSVRPNATSNWVGQESPNWTNAVNGVNNKHQDGDGNGIINLQDLQTLINNYGLTHPIASVDNSLTDGVTYKIKPVAYTGTNTLQYELYIEQDGAPVSLHGIACTIDFGDLPISSVSLDVSNSSLNPDQHLATYDAASNTMDIALTRTSKTNQAPIGPAAKFIILTDNIGSGESILIKTTNGGKIVANGTYNKVGNATFYDTYSNAPASNNNLLLSASIAHEQCDKLGAAELYITGGVAPYAIEWSTGATTTNLINLPADTYTVRVNDANGLEADYLVAIERQFVPIYDENGELINCNPISECINSITLEDNITNGIHQAAVSMTSSGVVPSGSDVTFKAGKSITLSSGFTVATGATFLAVIEDCASSTLTDQPQKSTYKTGITLNDKQRSPNELILQITPNPLRNQGIITYNLPASGQVQVTIADAQGHLVRLLQHKIHQETGKHQLDFFADDLPKGLYFMSIRTENEMKTRKFILLE